MEKGQSKQKTQRKLPKSVIIGIIAAAVVVLGLAIWAIVSIIVANRPIEQDWAQSYYEYLQEHKLPTKSQTASGEDYDVSEYEMGFYDVDGVEEPIMVVSYLDAEGKRQLTYYYQKSGEVAYETWMQGTNLALLYDIDRKAYDYYIHRTNDAGEEMYTRLAEDVIHHRDGIAEVAETQIFKKDDASKVTKSDGTELSVTKFEQTFVPVEDTTKTTRMPVNYSDSDLKSAMREDAGEMQWLKEIAQQHAERINQVIADIEQRKNEIAQVEEENVKKAAEEAARKAAEEEARKGFRLEGKFITYGTYQESVEGMTLSETITINRDYTGKYYDKNCTWSVGKKDFTQSPESTNIHEAVVFSCGGGYGGSLYAYRDNWLGDGDIQDYKLLRAQE